MTLQSRISGCPRVHSSIVPSNAEFFLPKVKVAFDSQMKKIDFFKLFQSKITPFTFQSDDIPEKLKAIAVERVVMMGGVTKS